LHRLQPVPVAVARHPALVPGGHRPQPDDLRQRRAARRARAERAAHRPVDLPARPARGRLPAARDRSARLLPAGDRLTMGTARPRVTRASASLAAIAALALPLCSNAATGPGRLALMPLPRQELGPGAAALVLAPGSGVDSNADAARHAGPG